MSQLSWEVKDLCQVFREIDPRPGNQMPIKMLYLRWTNHNAMAGNAALERALAEFEENEWITRDLTSVMLTKDGFDALR